MTGKRIALFLDGTWNTVNDDTNVWRMKSLCVSDADQVSYYSTGVGTTFLESLPGGIFGYGLENYNPDDRIFIFGFSRGAFTARSLSGLVSKCGLLKPGAPISLPQLYERYRKGSSVHTIRELKNVPPEKLSFEEKWLLKYSMAIPVWFVGVWDTVGALGVPFGHFPVISRSNYGFLETDLRINNARAYHAMAIDEHRQAFAPTLWTRTVAANASLDDGPKQRPLIEVEQRWFVGAHADIGGGYQNGMLSQIPLDWLMRKADVHGLKFRDTVVLDGNENRGTIHDSFWDMAHHVYWLAKRGKPYFRTIGAAPIQNAGNITTTINETIDGTVFDRWREDSAYRPANLVDWGKRKGLDLASLVASVRADDLSLVADETE
jgi:uncharacterized protein (DUF2235 family)